ncbi:MAG: Gfo/Idh/MocA family oxidoreductase [Dehalococcoidia bacterium]
MPDPLRIGFIGAGANTRSRHIPGFRAIDGVELVAVCNRSRESGQRVADEFGITRVETDPAAIFAADDVDAVCIGTWPYMHRAYAVSALEAGKHVLCEARMAMNATEARQMLAASEARPELVAQIVPGPFDLRSWRTIRRLVADGSLGDIREVHVTQLTGGSLNAGAPLHWRERVDYSGMNVMIFGILVEVVTRWLGPTRRVLADGAVFVRERRDADGRAHAIAVPDSLGVFAELERGGRVSYRVSTVLHAPRDANGISVYGSAGTLHWEMGDRMRFAKLGDEPAPLEPDAGTAGEWRVEGDFVDSIRDGAPVALTSFADGVHYMRVTEAVDRSRTEGRAVRLDEV